MSRAQGDDGDGHHSRAPRAKEAIDNTVEGNEFERVFRLYYPAVIRVLSLGSDDVTHAVQEAFVQAYFHWVRLVAVRRIVDTHRRRWRH
jgi:hypothetical protein